MANTAETTRVAPKFDPNVAPNALRNVVDRVCHIRLVALTSVIPAYRRGTPPSPERPGPFVFAAVHLYWAAGRRGELGATAADADDAFSSMWF